MTEYDPDIRGLTLYQPYARAIACGIKRIETRGWRTRYRGRLAIHAASSVPIGEASSQFEAILAALSAAGIDAGPVRARLGDASTWAFGAIVAVVRLRAVVPVEDLVVEPVEGVFGDYRPGRYGWMLAAVVPLSTPVPVSGKQRLWRLNADTLAAVEAAVRHS